MIYINERLIRARLEFVIVGDRCGNIVFTRIVVLREVTEVENLDRLLYDEI